MKLREIGRLINEKLDKHCQEICSVTVPVGLVIASYGPIFCGLNLEQQIVQTPVALAPVYVTMLGGLAITVKSFMAIHEYEQEAEPGKNFNERSPLGPFSYFKPL